MINILALLFLTFYFYLGIMQSYQLIEKKKLSDTFKFLEGGKMSKQIFNYRKRNIYNKSLNFYKEKEFENNFFKIHPEFQENISEKHKYYKCCLDYLENFMLYFPDNSLSRFEYFFIQKALNTLTPLAKPHELADFLKIDIDYIYDAIEDKIIPHFSYGSSYSIKTAEIIPFLKQSYGDILKRRKIFCGKH